MTVTLCFFPKGVKDDIFAPTWSILVGDEVMDGREVVGRRKAVKMENGIRRDKVGNRSIKWRRGKDKREVLVMVGWELMGYESRVGWTKGRQYKKCWLLRLRA